jgi:hypothetical protein
MSDDRQGRSGESGKILYCSFCGKSQHEVRKLIAGPSVFICDECVELCNDIIREELEEKAASSRSHLPKPREIMEVLDQYVVGQASSAASLLLMAGTHGKRYALPNSRVMIHQPSGGAQGQATDIEIQAREILYLRGKLNQIYVRHTGQPLEQIERDMERDRFMSGEEARAYGLIDSVLERRAEESVKPG